MSSALLVRAAYGPGERHDRHAHEYTGVSVVLAGSLVEQVGTSQVAAGPLSVVAKPAGTEHADVFGPAGAVLLRLQVAPAWLAPLDDGTAVVGRWRWSSAPATARWLLRLAATTADRPCSVDDGIAECLGALDDDAASATASGHVPVWLGHVRDRIRDARGCDVSVSALAREAGVHPVYLARRFRRAFGCSVIAFSQSERVHAAAAALADGRDSLSDVACRTGFADQSHLTRIFRRLTGVTPGGYRRLVWPVPNVQDSPTARR